MKTLHTQIQAGGNKVQVSLTEHYLDRSSFHQLGSDSADSRYKGVRHTPYPIQRRVQGRQTDANVFLWTFKLEHFFVCVCTRFQISI